MFYESNIMTILDVFISRGKTLTVVEEVIGSWGRAVVAVAVAARFEQDSTYGLFAGTKNWSL